MMPFDRESCNRMCCICAVSKNAPVPVLFARVPDYHHSPAQTIKGVAMADLTVSLSPLMDR